MISEPTEKKKSVDLRGAYNIPYCTVSERRETNWSKCMMTMAIRGKVSALPRPGGKKKNYYGNEQI
jgi:hypothetical protein